MIFTLVISFFILTACFSREEAKQEGRNAYEQENYLPIDEYDGEGFQLRKAKAEYAEIAKEQGKIVEQTVQDYFLEEYHSKVEIKNIVAAVDGVSVYLSAIEEPYFNSFAILPIDLKNEEIKTERIRTEEGQVENGIEGGLYAMAFPDEFEKLDSFLKNFQAKHPILGTPIELVEKVKGNGYSNQYYFLALFDDVFDKLFDSYIDQPKRTTKNLKKFFAKEPFEAENIAIAIEYYMEDADSEIDPQILETLQKELEELEGIPQGQYHLYLNDHLIDKKRGIGKKENTIEKTFIQKE